MNTEFADNIIYDYPEWHNKPFRLTIGEMKDPNLVFDNFFDIYSLPQMRECLREWLGTAVRGSEILSLDYLHLCETVEPPVEAVWVMQHTKKGPVKKKKK